MNNRKFIYDNIELESGNYSIEMFFALGAKLTPSLTDTIYCVESGIRIMNELSIIYDYDIDELVTLLGSMRIKLVDNSENDILVDSIFSKEIDYRNTTILFKRGNEVIFEGYLDDESAEYDKKEKEISIEYKPQTFKLKEKKIWNEDGTFPSGIADLGLNVENVNPLLTEDRTLYHNKVHDIISRIFKIVDKDVIVDFKPHSWRFGATENTCTTPLSSLYVLNYFLFGRYGENPAWNFGNGLGLSPGEQETFMDILKGLSFEFGAISGMVSSNKAIFVELNSINTPFYIEETELLEVKYKIDRPTIERLELNQMNGAYNWAVIQRSDKKVFDFETMKKNIFGDIYRRKLTSGEFTVTNYCMRSNETIGKSLQKEFLPKYWSEFFFSGLRKRTDEIRIKGVNQFFVGQLINVYGLNYHAFSQKVDYIENEISIDAIPMSAKSYAGELTTSFNDIPFVEETEKYAIAKSVMVSTTSSISLSGLQTVDSVELNEGDRVLVKDQVDSRENGIYEVSLTDWVRTNDLINGDLNSGAMVRVSSGNTNLNKWFGISDELVVGTSDIKFHEIGINQIDLNKKQDLLISGTNIKTVNGESVLGEGDIIMAGEINSGENLSANGLAVFARKSGLNLQFRPLVAGNNISLQYLNESGEGNNEIEISASIDKTDVGLSNVDNTSDANKPISNAVQTALTSKSDISHTHTKSDIGLGNADNTSDADKPISTAVQSALSGKISDGSNLGSGYGVFYGKTSDEMNFRSLKPGSNISMQLLNPNAEGNTEIEISAIIPASPEAGGINTASNVGTGIGVYHNNIDQNLEFKSLVAGSNISLQLLNEGGEGNTEIEISANIPTPGEINTASNLGAGVSVFSAKVNEDLQFKTLVAGNNISIENLNEAGVGNTEIQINSTVTKTSLGLENVNNTSDLNKPISTAAQTALNQKIENGNNLGSGFGVYYGKTNNDLDFRSLKAGNNISLQYLNPSAEGNTEIEINSTVSKETLGIANIDNTSDEDKPISTAAQLALNNKIESAQNLGSGIFPYYGKNDKTLQFKSFVAGDNITVENHNPDAEGNTEIKISAIIPDIPEVSTGANLGAGVTVFSSKVGTELQFKSLKAGQGISIENLNEGGEGNTEIGITSTVSKASLGIENIDNTSDLEKPISSLTQTALDTKVDKITGKGLSSEDYTLLEKTKLSGIQSGAQVNRVFSVAGKTGNVILVKDDVGLSSVDNSSDMDKPISTAVSNALASKLETISTAGNGISLFFNKTNQDVALRSLVAGNNVALTLLNESANGNDEIEISVTVDKADVGLSNVDNTSDINKPISNSVQTALDEKVNNGSNLGNGVTLFSNKDSNGNLSFKSLLAGTNIGIANINENGEGNNEIEISCNVSKSTLGIENVDNTSDLNKPVSTAQSTAITNAVAGKSDLGHTHTAEEIGLGNVDNTSDLNKPISTSTQTALDAKISDVSNIGTGLGIFNAKTNTEIELRSLKAGNNISLEYLNELGEGNTEIQISSNVSKSTLGLGNVNNTADIDKPISVATQSALDEKSNINHSHTKADIGLGSVDNTSDNDKPISSLAQTALDTKIEDANNLGSGLNVFYGKSNSDLSFRSLKAGSNISLQYLNPLAEGNTEIEISASMPSHTHSKAEVGLGSVDNTSDLAKPISTAAQTVLDSKIESAENVGSGVGLYYSESNNTLQFRSLVAGTNASISLLNEGGEGNNEIEISFILPAHSHTKEEVGLSDVDNTSDANKPISSAVATALGTKVDKITGKGLSTNDYTTTEKTKLSGIANGAEVNSVYSVAGKTGYVTLGKGDVGLSSVDNTSDLNKPISSATQTALNSKIETISKAGTGLGLFFEKASQDIALRSLVAGSNVSLQLLNESGNGNDEIQINSSIPSDLIAAANIINKLFEIDEVEDKVMLKGNIYFKENGSAGSVIASYLNGVFNTSPQTS